MTPVERLLPLILKVCSDEGVPTEVVKEKLFPVALMTGVVQTPSDCHGPLGSPGIWFYVYHFAIYFVPL